MFFAKISSTCIEVQNYTPINKIKYNISFDVEIDTGK